MSFAQFNGVTSTENLVVNSITYPDGSSQNSATSLTTYVATYPNGESQVCQNQVDVSYCLFSNLPAGNYLVSVPFGLAVSGGTGDFVNSIYISEKNNNFTFVNFNTATNVGIGQSGYTNYTLTPTIFVSLEGPSDSLVIDFVGGTHNSGTFTLSASDVAPSAVRLGQPVV